MYAGIGSQWGNSLDSAQSRKKSWKENSYSLLGLGFRVISVRVMFRVRVRVAVKVRNIV